MGQRNYIRDSHAVGRTYKQIASELHVSPATVSSYARGLTTPKHSYEQLRNVYRRSAYHKMRASGYSSRQASEARREVPADIEYRGDWMNSVINVIDKRWNRKHRNPSDPKHMSRKELQRCIQMGIDRGLSREQIEERYW